MFGVGSWFAGKKPSPNASTHSLESSLELQNLEDAMQAATLILNDDVDGAEDGLSDRVSAYHLLGRGVVSFIRATLGFEQDMMRQASERLSAAETMASADQQRAKSNSTSPKFYHSDIYAPGTEFLLCQAMAQLMSAVVAVLSESLTESIKGFYKLRKAYLALDSILKMEQKYMQSHRLNGTAFSKISPTSTHASEPELASESSPNPSPNASELSQNLSDLKLASGTSTPDVLSPEPDSDIFQNSIDVFVHSGANFCFGVLLLIIGMVPPAFSKLLSIIGFYGDKERGLRMLWQASKFHNLTGAIAALTILAYYNAFARYCDIMPDIIPGENGDVQGYPREKLEALLARMRGQFPNSQLWILEESRMHGATKKLDLALEVLCGEAHSPLKQVEALKVFERSMNAMYLHRYALCADSFVECADLNSWSRALYYYIAGASHLCLYREFLSTDPSQANKHADKATSFFQKAPQFAGKKRFMARQLPFDVFVTRKIAKWEARAKEWDVPLVDAVGVDPIEEMIFFWNGHSRMTEEQLADSMRRLSWFESDDNKMSSRESADEKAISHILRATVLRSLGKHEESKETLQTNIFTQDKSLFKGHLKDDWIYPVAYFEMAANFWMERPTYIAIHGSSDDLSPESVKGADWLSVEREKVRECKDYLEKAARWETYELEARMGLKVTAGKEAVEKWEKQHSISQ